MIRQAPEPQAIIQLVKCGCQKNRYSNNRCQCRKTGLMKRTVRITVLCKLSTTTLTVMGRKVTKMKPVVNMVFLSFLEMEIRVQFR